MLQQILHKEYYTKHLDSDIRPDGRELWEFRPAIYSFRSISSADGSSSVSIGDTKVICAITARLAKPAHSSNSGFLCVDVNIPPVLHSQIKTPKSLSSYYKQILRNALVGPSGCLNLESLCIKAEHLVWSLYCDVLCIDNSGSLLDAALFGLVAALQDTQLPTVDVNPGSEKPYVVSNSFSSLSLKQPLPVCTSFICALEGTMIADPTLDEETLFNDDSLIILNSSNDGQIVCQPCSTPLPIAVYKSCFERSRARSIEIRKLLSENTKSSNMSNAHFANNLAAEMHKFEQEISSSSGKSMPPPAMQMPPIRLQRPSGPIQMSVGPSPSQGMRPAIPMFLPPQIQQAPTNVRPPWQPPPGQLPPVPKPAVYAARPTVSQASLQSHAAGNIRPTQSTARQQTSISAAARARIIGRRYNPVLKKFIRSAGGSTWEDKSLADWDPNSFRIFCGDLGNEVTDDHLSRAFSQYPSLQKAKVIRDKRSKKTKGYGFVSFKDPDDYIKAMREMNGKYVGNRPIKLRKSNWKDRNIEEVRKKDKMKKKLGLR